MKLYIEEDGGRYYICDNQEEADYEIDVSEEQMKFIKRVYEEYDIAHDLITKSFGDNSSRNLWAERHEHDKE